MLHEASSADLAAQAPVPASAPGADQAERWRAVDASARRERAVRHLGPLRAILQSPFHEAQRETLSCVRRLEFTPGYEHGLTEQRRRVTEAMRALAGAGVGRWIGARASGELGLSRSLAVLESLAWADTGLYLKAAVQFGLVSHGVLVSGTQRHHRAYVDDIVAARRCGCYAMTEVGHGSNVRGLQTTATYEPGTDEFVIHTPTDTAVKQMVGNAAADADFALVFAQLVVADLRPGVFGFVVPLRGRDGVATRGVRRGDMGVKGGFNGIDNGWLRFDHVRVPRGNMLDRYGAVRPGGRYQGQVSDPTKALLSTVSDGRLVSTVGALGALKVGVAVAVRYASRRRQFGPRRGPEVPLLSYPAHQRRLLPAVAAAYALDLACKQVVAARETGGASTEDLDRDCAALKVASSSVAIQALQTCRECCGGQGYLAANRVVHLRADVDALATLEGDNTLLRFQVAKLVLGVQARRGVRGLAMVALRHARGSLGPGSFGRGPLAPVQGLLAARLQRLVGRVGVEVFRAARSGGRWAGFVQSQPGLLNLADAYIDTMLCDALSDAIDAHSGMGARTLAQLRDLFGLTVILDSAASYVRLRIVRPRELDEVSRRVARLCCELSSDAVGLIDAFDIPESCLAPIARGRGLPEFLLHQDP